MSSNCTIIDDLKESNDYIYKDIVINHCKMKIIYNETLIHTYNMNQTISLPYATNELHLGTPSFHYI